MSTTTSNGRELDELEIAIEQALPPLGAREVAVVRAESPALRRRIGKVLESAGLSFEIASEEGEDGVGAGDLVLLACSQVDGRCAEVVRSLSDPPVGAFVVVILPESSGRTGVRRAVAAGATGVVYESFLTTTLAPTLCAVRAGQVSIPAPARVGVCAPVLSRREKEAVRLAVSGYSNNEIAAALFLATSTVKSHLASAFNKLGVHSRNEAAAILLDPEEPLGQVILGTAPARNPGANPDE